MEALTISAEIAPKVRDWIATRNGVAVWKSQDLSRAGEEVLTPATRHDGVLADKASKPRWDVAFDRIVTDARDVLVANTREVKRFRVGLQRGSGLSIVLTDAASRRVREAKAKAGSGAFHVFDHDDAGRAVAVIMVPTDTTTLDSWTEGA